MNLNHPKLTQLGDAWLNSLENAILRVPSAIIPQEYNYLLNPSHPDFSHIRINVPETFEFDDRLWKT
jgi:RES domain-containing protein